MSKVIVRNVDILGGEPVFKGTSVPVKSLFDHLEAGNSIEVFLDSFPSVKREQVTTLLKESKAHSLVHSRIIKKHPWYEEYFESTLFNCRFLVLFAVLGSMIAAAVLFLKGSLEIIQGINGFSRIMSNFNPTESDDKTVILAFIPAIDNYLFATVLLIFSMGIYELFVSKIDPTLRKPFSRPDWLNIRDLDDLKTHVSEVVVMIFIINFFKLSFTVQLDRPVDLLLLGGGVFLVTAALFITHKMMFHRSESANRKNRSLEKADG